MDGIRTTITKKPFMAEKVVRQMNYGTAVGLTRTAQEARQAVIGSWRGKFTIRNKWLESSPIGPKARPASKNAVPIAAAVTMSAKFGPLQEEGGTKLPYKNYLAIPTENARKSKSGLIPTALRPANLKNAFVIVTKDGKRLLCVRKSSGRGKKRTSGVVVMYVLVKRATVKKKDVFFDPIKKVVERRMILNVRREIDTALAGMK